MNSKMVGILAAVSSLVVLPFVTIVAIVNVGTPLAAVSGIADQVELVRSSVVHISKEGVCQGSGCILSEDGIVFTAKHVTDGGGNFTVTLDDGREFKTTACVEDKNYDVAFLYLNTHGLKPAKLADLSTVRVGDPIFLMGSPLGKENFNSVTLGILSAEQRDMSTWASDPFMKNWSVMFQSDTSAYPGNSGGPVFNLQGNVIGVLCAGVRSTMNYSVPVGVFKNSLDIVRAWFAMNRFEIHNYEPPVESPNYEGEIMIVHGNHP
jgi:S1-C subfamily serine protease